MLKGATTCRTPLNAQKIEEQHGNKTIGNVRVRGNGNKVFGNPGKFQQVARPAKGLGSQRQRVDDVDNNLVWNPQQKNVITTKMSNNNVIIRMVIQKTNVITKTTRVTITKTKSVMIKRAP